MATIRPTMPARPLANSDAAGKHADEQGQKPGVAAAVGLAAPLATDGRRQVFAIDQLDQHAGGVSDAASIVTTAEARHQVFLDDPVGDGIGNRALQAVTGLDAYPSVILGHHQQHAVIHALAADLPLVEDARGVLRDVFRLGGGHDQHLQLAALALLQVSRLLHQRLLLRGIQRAGGIDHRRIQRRNRRQLLRLRRQWQPQQQGQQRSGQAHRSVARLRCRLLLRRVAEIDRRRAGDLRFVVHGEVRLGLVAEDLGGDHLRERADVGVVVLHLLDVTATCDGDPVLGTFQLRLQVAEVLVGLQLRIVFGDHQQPRQRAAQFALGLLELLERGFVVGVDVDLADPRAGVGDFGQHALFLAGEALHGLHQVGHQVGAALVLVDDFRPAIKK
ncbi:hypothetical protein G6F31_014320 [Rhizopus arrhizus]|nr:hypothetical protein G6F31_014320 [Rhizopus arrhizus]